MRFQQFQTRKGRAVDRNSDDRQRGFGGGDSSEMSGTSGAGDNHLQSSFACGSYILESSMGLTVRAIHPNLIWNFELLQDLRGFLHDRKIRVAAHDNADERFHLCFASPFFPMSFR